MGFIGDIFSAIVSVIVSIVEAIVQVVEMVIQLIMVLLGFDGGSTQIIEYFEVRNYPLFDDIDHKNPIQQSLLQSILSNKDLSTTLIYNLVFRSLRGNVKDFMKFIENGNYFEGFPELDSYILIIDYDELVAALQTLTGVACTAEVSALRALSNADWVKYWLQENKDYNVGANLLGTEYREVTTSPATPAADGFSVNFVPPNQINIDITSEIATQDDVLADTRWHVDMGAIVYNSVPDTYTVEVYNASGATRILPYTVPSKPTELHYVVEYYQNSTPSRTYLFVYKVGTNVYPDLDTVEEPINIDNTSLQAINSIPLRISNANYTTFGATKKQQIEDLLAILNLDAEEIINGVLSDSGLAPGDVDHVYVTFGVRMWDTSQAGMSYLFRMFENLYPAQGSTQGNYNNTAPADDKPTNNILTTTEDNKLAFQFNYITYTFTSLATIDSNSGSTENGIYYSDMSKFGPDGLLQYPYYSSSGKGTYNVGYKADNLTEVQDFLDGNGVPNPGTTSTEAADWLQVTERMVYNNPTPALLEAGGGASTLIYLTPDMVYKNNGSGTLQMLEQAAEETTSGQSITYYKIKPNGLDAYTVSAPIAAMRVVDGATGHFKTVKFNLGNKNDLMVPFVYTFVKDLSHTDQGKLFLAGAHVSIYVAHYEVIHHAGMSFFQALVMIIIIIVIIYFTWGADGGTATGAFIKAFGAAAAVGVGAVIKLILTKLITYAFKFIVQSIIQMIIAELVDDPTLRMILSLMASVAIMSWEGNLSYGPEGTEFIGPIDPSATSSFHFNSMTSFKSPLSFTPMQWGSIALNVFDGIGSLRAASLQSAADMLSSESTAWNKARAKKLREISEMEDFINKENYGMSTAAATRQVWRRRNNPGGMSAQQTIDGMLGMVEITLSKISIMPHFNFYDALYENV